jgi:thiol-disulfide isomerase/thioredoxin
MNKNKQLPMNSFRIFLFVILSLSTSYAQKKLNLSFKVEGINNGTAKMVGIYADGNFMADTSVIAPDGSFSFNGGKDGYYEGFYYMVMPDNTNFPFLLANGENFSMKTKVGDLINAMQVEGTAENKLFYESQKYQMLMEQKFNTTSQRLKTSIKGTPQYQTTEKELEAILADRDVVLEDLRKNHPNTFFTKFKLAGQNPKYRYEYKANGVMDTLKTLYNYRQDWWNDYDFTDERLVRTPVFFNKLKKYHAELMPQNPDSCIAYSDLLIDKTLNNKEYFKMVANWMALQHKPGITKMMDGEAVYSHIILKYFTAEKDDWDSPSDLISIRKNAQEMRTSLIGMTGQDVRAANPNGVTKSLYDMKSPITIMFIYNPDCEHCQKEAPEIRAFYDKWKSKGVGVFSIAANAKNQKEWFDFRAKYGVNWDTDVIDPELKSRYHEKYFIDITPEIYVLDKNHKIIAKNLRPHQLEEVVENELKKQ